MGSRHRPVRKPEENAMTATTDPFVEIVGRTQELATAAVRTWTDSVQSVVGTDRAALPNPQSVVDGWFDLVQQALDGQRKLAHTMVSAGSQVAGSVARAGGDTPAS
jgi:hypothetical protein